MVIIIRKDGTIENDGNTSQKDLDIAKSISERNKSTKNYDNKQETSIKTSNQIKNLNPIPLKTTVKTSGYINIPPNPYTANNIQGMSIAPEMQETKENTTSKNWLTNAFDSYTNWAKNLDDNRRARDWSFGPYKEVVTVIRSGLNNDIVKDEKQAISNANLKTSIADYSDKSSIADKRIDLNNKNLFEQFGLFTSDYENNLTDIRQQQLLSQASQEQQINYLKDFLTYGKQEQQIRDSASGINITLPASSQAPYNPPYTMGETNEGFDWSKTALIGGGLIAGLLVINNITKR